jgi:LytR cell envelope-related transcriptional attenuator
MDLRHPRPAARPEHVRREARSALLLALVLSAIFLLARGAAAWAAESAPAASAPMPPASAAGVTLPATLPAAVGAAPAAPAAAEPPEEADLLIAPEPPTRVRVAILNATGKPGGANKVAVLLSEYKRRAIEDQIGLQIEVVNLSSAESVRPGQTILFYRPEFLRAALAMAQAIPGEQFVEPMRPSGMKRAGVDVEIVVGEELP